MSSLSGLSRWRLLPPSVHEVFSRNHAAPFSKVLTFLRRGPFELEAFYSDPQGVPYPEAKIGKPVMVCTCPLQRLSCEEAALTWRLAGLAAAWPSCWDRVCVCRRLAAHTDLPPRWSVVGRVLTSDWKLGSHSREPRSSCVLRSL